MTWLPYLFLIVGLLIITGMVVAIFRVDEYWRPHIVECDECTHRWTGRDRICSRCCGLGYLVPPPTRRSSP